MIVAVCILGVLLLGSLFLNAVLWIAIQRLMGVIVREIVDPKELLDNYYEKESVEHFPCHLLLSIHESADFDGSVYDFSQYEENKIIGLTEFRTTVTEKMKLDEDGEPMTALLPNQTVCKMKDGSFQWDIRPHI